MLVGGEEIRKVIGEIDEMEAKKQYKNQWN